MKKPTDVGKNRTGAAMSPIDSARTVEGAEEAATLTPTDGRLMAAERLAWAKDADPIGTVPPPASLKGAAKTAIEFLQGHKPTVFIDKLGERLAFERTGTRLYEALLVKFDAADVHEGGPTREDLEHIHADEIRHFAVLRDAMEQLGCDPTAMTPGADIVAVAGLGWIQVLTDPRTTFTQCLDTILIAELADNDGWMLLVDLAAALGFDDLAAKFRSAHIEEETHLARVRHWLSAAIHGQAGVAPTPPQTSPSQTI